MISVTCSKNLFQSAFGFTLEAVKSFKVSFLVDFLGVLRPRTTAQKHPILDTLGHFCGGALPVTAQECATNTLQKMVALLKAQGVIKDARVETTMLKVDRSFYNPSPTPYMDSPHAIGYNATISAPHMHAHALEHLKDKLIDGARVLDVGSGSGYLTACMAHMVRPSGKVFGVEHIDELVKQSLENIRRDCPELLDTGGLKIIHTDGRAGLPDESPFDVIHVGATAPGLPGQLIEQLKEGGRMVVPIQHNYHQVFESIEKLAGGEIKRKELFGVRYVPLTDVESQLTQK